MRALVMLAVAALTWTTAPTWTAAPTGTSVATDAGTRPVDTSSLHPLLRELDGRTFEATGTFSDALGGPTDLYPGASLRLTFTGGAATATTSCGDNTYPALVVGPSDGSAATPIDFGRPSGPGCRMGPDGLDIPTGTLLWTDGGHGSYGIGNGYSGLTLTEAGRGPVDVAPVQRFPLTAWLVASALTLVAVLGGWVLLRRRLARHDAPDGPAPVRR